MVAIFVFPFVVIAVNLRIHTRKKNHTINAQFAIVAYYTSLMYNISWYIEKMRAHLLETLIIGVYQHTEQETFTKTFN